jgi:hypothetical protein
MTVQHETAVPANGSVESEQPKPAQLADRASTEASNVASTAADGVREVADEVRTQAKAVAGEARQHFDALITQARDEVSGQAQQRSDQAATRLRTLSKQLVALADGRPESAGPLAGYLYDAEDQVRRLASRLEQGGPQGVIDDVTRFARRRPGLFLAGAMAAGFLVGRAMRAGAASQRVREATSEPGGSTGYGSHASGVGVTAGQPTLPAGGGPSTAGSLPTSGEEPGESVPPTDPDPGFRP